VRNLLADPPPVLQGRGWEKLVAEIGKLLDELRQLASQQTADPQAWWDWREGAIGRNGWLRQAFLSTLAETRLPNNDVTLWDQSYVAAALFKSAVAGAVLAGNSFQWDNQLKQQTRWRVLTVGFGTRHYEARAVKIGDWAGAQRDIERFFEGVRKLIEIDLAVGSLVYRDDETLAFTFPGQRQDSQGGLGDEEATALCEAIREAIDQLAQQTKLETPPWCDLSASTRSFVPMVAELRQSRDELAVPIHREWKIDSGDTTQSSGARHVCPVCLVRLNAAPSGANTDNARKSYPCDVCRERRRGRLDAWLDGEADTIWIDEVADGNDRVALLTFSFDLEPWLEGAHVDSLRAQSIAEWQKFNPQLGGRSNPVDPANPLGSVRGHIKSKLASFDRNDPVLSSLQEGYRHESAWKPYFEKIVEDRADGPSWDNLDDQGRACWLAHQLFRKLPSPGRVHRFWRTCEAFFDELLERFREIAAVHPNRWRTRRLILIPDDASRNVGWEDRETYDGRWREEPLEVVYRAECNEFVTIGNLARCLDATETAEVLRQQSIELRGDDNQVRKLAIKSVRTPENLGVYAPVIPLDRSPQRFRVLVPLDRATACTEAAVAKWREEFARVWDRMPMRIGVVAFPRLTPIQAVIEAARNLEDELGRDRTQTWRVIECRTREGVTALSLEHDHGQELVLVPTRLPDGREDVFYPYVRVEDRHVRFPRDFEHPRGQVYRHMADLRPGDGLRVDESRIAAVFLDTTARRFERPHVWPLSEFEHMRAVWDLLVRRSPSLSALRGAWSELEERWRTWRHPDGTWLPGGEAEWLELARATLKTRLGASGAVLDALVEAAGRGTLGWALEWHLTWLKQNLEGVET
jgi:CRISPR-associated Csx11 family protein